MDQFGCAYVYYIVFIRMNHIAYFVKSDLQKKMEIAMEHEIEQKKMK